MPKGAHGGFAEYAVCPSVSAFPMPDSIPLPDAAALYFPFHLAWLGLFDRAHLQAGETVLVHAAAGGSGSAAVQLAARARRARHRNRVDRGEARAVSRARRRRRDQLRVGRLLGRCARRDRRSRRRRGVRQRRRGGVRALARMPGLRRPLPDDGLRLGQDGRRRAVDRAPPDRARQRQAVRRAARLRRRRGVDDGEAGDGLELRVGGARRADHVGGRRSRRGAEDPRGRR